MNKFMKWLYGKKIEIEMNKSADKINVEKIRTWIKEVESEADTQEERDKMEAMTRRLMAVSYTHLAVETNRIAAYSDLTKKTMGANWHRADSGLYQCMSNAISSGSEYTVAGRGNTNYQSKYGLNSITLTGYFRADND